MCCMVAKNVLEYWYKLMQEDAPAMRRRVKQI